MPIDAWHLYPYCLPLRHAWRSAQGSFTARRGWLVCLEASGLSGFGDCAPLPQIGTESPARATAWLQHTLELLPGKTAAEALAGLPPTEEAPPAARCGVETALLDLAARQAGIGLAHHLSPTAVASVPVNANIGSLNRGAPQRAEKAVRRGFNTLKLKVGLASVVEELALLQELVAALPTTVQLRLDANRAWSMKHARRFLEGIRRLPVESLEEPLEEPSLDTLGELQVLATCDLALDESLHGIAPAQLLEKRPVKRLILKPMVQGGLLPCLQIALQARSTGLKPVITTAVESAAGIWATTQLAAAVGGHAAHGLATARWLAKDLGAPPLIEQGYIHLPSTPGSGFQPSSTSLKATYTSR